VPARSRHKVFDVKPICQLNYTTPIFTSTTREALPLVEYVGQLAEVEPGWPNRQRPSSGSHAELPGGRSLSERRHC
jgi:hypothetical protein